MTLLYIYLAGIIVVLLMILCMGWLRMDKWETITNICLSIFSWISVINILSVEYEFWKNKRKIMKKVNDLPKEE